MKPGDLVIRKGNLFQGHSWDSKPSPVFVEVLRTYDKADIDPECPESVAIVGMVEARVLSGQDIGKTRRYRRTQFRRVFTPVDRVP